MNGEQLGGVLSASLPAPAWWVVAATGAVAVLSMAASLMPGWRGRFHGRGLAGFGALGTLVHEAGHAAAAVVTGGGVYTIDVYDADSGVAYTWYPSWLSSVLTKAAGYAAPPLAGLGAAVLLDQGRAAAVLTITAAVMLALLLVARGWFTFAVVVAVGGSAFAALHWGSPLAQQALAYGLAWLLLVSEVGGLIGLAWHWWHGPAPDDGDHEHHDDHDDHDVGDDATGLAYLTRIPAPVWILGWFALVGWSWWVGVPLLWP